MSLPSCSLDLGLHALGDPVTEDPHFGAFTQDGIPKKQTQLTLLGLVVVKELRKRYPSITLTDEELCAEANKWELSHGGISGRTAQQFINYMAGMAPAAE